MNQKIILWGRKSSLLLDWGPTWLIQGECISRSVSYICKDSFSKYGHIHRFQAVISFKKTIQPTTGPTWIIQGRLLMSRSLTWLHLQRPYFQRTSHSQVLGIRKCMCHWESCPSHHPVDVLCGLNYFLHVKCLHQCLALSEGPICID